MPPEDYTPPWMDPDYFKRIKAYLEELKRAAQTREEAAYARMMRECFGGTKDPQRPIEHRAPDKLDPRQYGPQDIDALLRSL